jgi:clorobiocin biosynthesis protein CloN5
MKTEDVLPELLEFVRDQFLWDDETRELDESTPLLEWGIIDSLRTTVLLAHIRERFEVHVSPAKVNARNFRDLSSIAALVCEQAVPEPTHR